MLAFSDNGKYGSVMPDVLSAIEIQKRARERGMNVEQLLRKAEVNRSMWTRWQGGKDINLKTYRKLLSAIDTATVEDETP